MVLWRSELRVSLRARWVSLLLHGAVTLALLFAPWPAGYRLIWMLLLLLVTGECIRSQRRIGRRTGDIRLTEPRKLEWRQQRWQIGGRPWITRQAILLVLRSQQGDGENLWLFRDSMDEAAWRQLRQQLRNPTAAS